MKHTKTLSALLFLAAGCTAVGSGSGDLNNDPPLANVDELLEGAPKADDIERAFKADGPLPASYSELRSLMSPVRSQGRRGVCSIFSTVALMEHLYIAEGTILEPDFSEQYLQWSAKFEVGSFPGSGGSNATYNLRAISDYGIPAEQAWPYEIDQWDGSNDPECEPGEDGDDNLPTRCYTNGQAPQDAQDAPQYHLPSSRWLHRDDIRAHIKNNGTGVLAGMTFFYQSWNHRRSELPVNSDYWNEGYVLAPNARDREISLEKRAGHSILLIGWDDDLEVQRVDEDGELVVDDDGNPVMEKGFYLFKNSWGTSGFGIDNEHGPGYGWISMEYIHEFARLRTSAPPTEGVHFDAPTPQAADEICDDGIDNDGNGAADCADDACSEDASCDEPEPTGAEVEASSEELISIPDNSADGISSTLVFDAEGTIASMTVDVDITHTYRGDLVVTLSRGDTRVTLHDMEGSGEDDLVKTYELSEFAGQELAGEWTLTVSDNLSRDEGQLNSWSLRATTE